MTHLSKNRKISRMFKKEIKKVASIEFRTKMNYILGTIVPIMFNTQELCVHFLTYLLIQNFSNFAFTS